MTKPKLELYSADSWRHCTPASLRGHIVNVHLKPITLYMLGLPVFDVGIARHREIDLDWVVGKAVDRLADAETIVGAEGAESEVRAYRTMLSKTLRLIEDADLSRVPWQDVETIFPGASQLGIDPVHDTPDRPFEA